MMIRLSEAEFMDMLHKTPLGEFVEMDEGEYQQLLRKAETIVYRLRNFQTVRPILVSFKTIAN